jgi:hypothetical protein
MAIYHILEGRKVLYYLGSAMVILGAFLGISPGIILGWTVPPLISQQLSWANLGTEIVPKLVMAMAVFFLGLWTLIAGAVLRAVGLRVLGVPDPWLRLVPNRAQENVEPLVRVVVKCRTCGSHNDEDAKFCKACGQAL